MTGTLKSLLSVSEKYFSPTAEGGANNIFLEKPWGGAYRGRGAKWDEYGISFFLTINQRANEPVLTWDYLFWASLW